MSQHGRPLILCALAYEAAALRRAGMRDRFDIVTCGPGPEGIRRCATRQDDRPRPVVLAGLAGSLSADWPVGRAAWAARVLDEAGRTWTPSWPLEHKVSAARVDVLSVARIVRDRAERERRHAQTGAALVDLESAAFAETASERGWTWGVARTVSDDLSTGLPIETSDWIDEHGVSRPGAVLRSLIRRPQDLAHVIRLARNSRRAIAALAAMLDQSMNEDS